MTNVIPFRPRGPKKEIVPILEPQDLGEKKMEALSEAMSAPDYAPFIQMLQSFEGFFQAADQRAGLEEQVDYVKDVFAYEMNSPAPGTVNFVLFGWTDTSKPRTENPRDVSVPFLSISQTKIEASVDPNPTRGDLCLRKMQAFVDGWEKQLKEKPLVQSVCPMLAIGYLVRPGGYITSYRVPVSYNDKFVVTIQVPGINTEYRLEVIYSSLESPK